jgi:hypothetical protein
MATFLLFENQSEPPFRSGAARRSNLRLARRPRVRHRSPPRRRATYAAGFTSFRLAVFPKDKAAGTCNTDGLSFLDAERTLTVPNPNSAFGRQSSPTGLTTVRSAHVREGGTFTHCSAFVVEDGRCWRPGYPTPDGLEPDPARALRRHAEHAAVSASEKARRAA